MSETAQGERDRKLSGVFSRERRSYLILVGISVFLSGLVLLWGIKTVHDNNQHFCQFISSEITGPVVKPANPAANPSREKIWEATVKLIVLGDSLDCRNLPAIK